MSRGGKLARCGLVPQEVEHVRDRSAMAEADAVVPRARIRECTTRSIRRKFRRCVEALEFAAKDTLRTSAILAVERKLQARRAGVENENRRWHSAIHPTVRNSGVDGARCARMVPPSDSKCTWRLAPPAQPAYGSQLGDRGCQLPFRRGNLRFRRLVLHRLFRRALRLERLGLVEVL